MRTPTLLLVVLLSLASACGGGTSPADVQEAADATAGQSQPSAATQTTAAPSVEAGSPVPEALAFSASTIAGDAFQGGDYAGQDLLLWFWAPW